MFSKPIGRGEVLTRRKARTNSSAVSAVETPIAKNTIQKRKSRGAPPACSACWGGVVSLWGLAVIGTGVPTRVMSPAERLGLSLPACGEAWKVGVGLADSAIVVVARQKCVREVGTWRVLEAELSEASEWQRGIGRG
jgi:hypothetical protein